MSVRFGDDFRLKILDYTCYDLFAPHGVLDVLQDIAGKHATTFQMGYDDLIAKNQIWVLLRVKYKVIKDIRLYSKIHVETYAKPKGLVDFDRETQIFDLNGNLFINATSKWVILDATTRKIIPAKHVQYNVQTCEDSLFDTKLDKIKDFDYLNCPCYHQVVQFCDCDHNGHTNNAKYAQMLLNALRLKKNEFIDTFQIDFVNESHLDDDICIYYKKDQKDYLAKALCNDKVIFMAKIMIR